MPRKRALLGDLLPTYGPREELIEVSSGTEFTIRELSIRIVNLPLFRRSKDGKLEQALRIIAKTESRSREEISFSVADKKAVLDRTVVRIDKGRTLIHLFIPEVHEKRQVIFEISSGAGKPFRREVEVLPQRKWSVHLIHHSHLDIGYTDTQGSVLQHHLGYLDSALDLVSATDDWQDEAQFRWNIEATWPLRHWLKVRPSTDTEELFERIRQGRIEICALPFSMHTEAYSIDELACQLRFADELRAEHGLPVTTAMQTDVPGATIGLLTTLVDADVRYLSVAHNYAGRSVPHLVGGQELTRPFWWQAPNGKRLLVWYTDSPHGSAYMEGNFVGLAEGYEVALETLPGYLKALAERPYPYGQGVFGWMGLPNEVEVTKRPYPHDILHLRVQGVIADNAAPSMTPAEIVREWNDSWAYPQLRMATNRDFFSAVEERIGDQLETYSGDWTDWWADGIGSAARQLGFNRCTQARLRTAQTLHALADTLGEDGADVSEEVESAYENAALFDEHTWGASNPWNDELDQTESGALQWDKKASFAREAFDGANTLVESGIHRWSRLFGASDSSTTSVLVINPSRWERTDLVRVFVPSSKIRGQSPFALIDLATQRQIPYAVTGQENARHRPRGVYVNFVARNVPPCGYASYGLVEASPENTGDLRPQDELAMENEHYLIQIDPLEGPVSRILDKDSGQDLVNHDAPFGFNQYTYDRYTSAPHFNHLSGRIQATDLSLLGERSVARYGVVTERSSNPVWDRMTVRLSAEGADFVETTLTLLRGVRRLDIKNRIGKIGTPQKEAVYFAFPFNIEEPSIGYEITGGIDSQTSSHIPGSAEHMRAIRHWITLENEVSKVAWATLEAPLVQFGNIHLPYAPFPKTLKAQQAHPATIYSWPLNNIWDTNFPPQQQGEMEFHYSVATGDDVGAKELGMHTASTLTSPLLSVVSAPTAAGEMPARGSFCSVDRPEVEITHFAASRRGHDLTLFLQSHAPNTVEARVWFPLLSVKRAWTGTHLERYLEEAKVEQGEVRVTVPAGSYMSLTIDLADTKQARK